MKNFLSLFLLFSVLFAFSFFFLVWFSSYLTLPCNFRLKIDNWISGFEKRIPVLSLDFVYPRRLIKNCQDFDSYAYGYLEIFSDNTFDKEELEEYDIGNFRFGDDVNYTVNLILLDGTKISLGNFNAYEGYDIPILRVFVPDFYKGYVFDKHMLFLNEGSCIPELANCFADGDKQEEELFSFISPFFVAKGDLLRIYFGISVDDCLRGSGTCVERIKKMELFKIN